MLIVNFYNFMYFNGYFVFVVYLLGACTNSNTKRPAELADRTFEYQLDGGRFAVVVVMDGISAAEAKQRARQRAAEITVSQGDRYFTIDSEEKIEGIQSEENQRFYGNLYQELIIEGDFSRESYRGISTLYSAIRLVFTSYKTRPNRKAIDACTLTNCH